MTLTHAEQARLAHQALRLRESGFTSEADVRDLANLAASQGDGDAEINISRRARTVPLAGVAKAVIDTLEPARPGPTDRKAVERLFNDDSLDDIWKRWDAAVTANLEQILPADELEAWRESVARDQKGFEDRVALMTGATEGELLDRARESLIAGGLSDEEVERLASRLAIPPGGPHEWAVHPYFGHLRHIAGAANALYDLGREGFTDGSVQWPTPTIKVALVDSSVYTVNLATHQFMSSVASTVAVSGALTTKTKAAGVLDADDFAFSLVSGLQSESLIIFQSSAVGGGADVATSAQRLIGYIDTATGLPVTPNGGNINVVWDSGSNRIVKI